MNTDDAIYNIGLTQHKYAKNVRFRGYEKSMRVENIPGTNLIPNQYLPAGANECIGAFYDDQKQRVFWFNFNSLGNHGVYQYTISSGAVARIAMVGYNTDGDIFGFTLNGAIYNVKMLYGDAIQGDTLYFNNSQKQPCQINILRALTGGYGTIKRTYIDVIKAPPIMPPANVFIDDAAVLVNNMRKQLFKIKIRYVYSSKEKSVPSSQGELSLPTNYTDTDIDKDPTKNCAIAIVVPTGEADVVKIEIWAAVSEGNVFSDYSLIYTIDKAASGIASNDLTTFKWYNNQAYVPVDVNESIQTYDLVPLTANALEIIGNGTVPIYAGITEGFNPTTVTGATTSTTEPAQTTQPPFVFISNQSGDSGFGSGNIHTVLIGKIIVGDTFTIYTTTKTVTFVATVATTASVIAGLAAAAIVAGFTVVSSDTENLVITQAGESLQRILATPLLIAVSDSFVYDWNSRYAYALTYFDKAGRTIGAQTNQTFTFQTANYTETVGVPNIPKLQFSITNRPPIEAYYYQICRTRNLSKLRTLYWVSDRTYKDTEFAYISIENLNLFIKNNPNSGFLAFEPATNDRIRFLKVLSGTVNTVYTAEDFTIVGNLQNPTINGDVKIGQFLKIALPTTSGTFDFGTSDFYNYLINLYSPAQQNSEGLDLYYEFGERYTIGNPGTANAYHQGMLQNQTSNLATPATFEFTKGDDYLRPRTINVGAEYIYTCPVGEKGEGRITLGCNYTSSTYVDPNITPGNSPLQDLAGFDISTNTDRSIITIGTGTFTFRLKGSIKVTFNEFGETYSFYFANNLDERTYIALPQGYPPNIVHVIDFDVSITMTTGQRLFIFGFSEGDYNNSKQFAESTITVTRELPFTQTIIDPNFSDFFKSAVNSNATAGRSYIVDVNAQQVFIGNLLRWGKAYVPNSNMNQTNRFYALNFEEIDGAKGAIQRLKVRDRILRGFQERACFQLGIFSKFVQDSGGTNILTTTDDIIAKNNVQYYAGVFGLGTQPTSLVSGKIADYFVDPVRGYQLRLSGDGITPISETYKGQYFIQPLFVPYNFDYLRTNGSRAKILGYYDYAEEQYITVLQGGTLSSNEIGNYTFSFNEKRNSYCSFYDFHPEWIISSNDNTISWKNGQMYIHNNEEQWCNFYGTQYYPSILLPFNDQIAIKKTFDAIAYQSNNKWTCPNDGDILTTQSNEQTGMEQISKLKDFDFKPQEGIQYASFKRDLNSRQNKNDAWYNGDILKGTAIFVNLTYLGIDFSWLFLPYVNYSISSRNF